jgi:surfeit locus 1 family protein
LNRPGAPRRLLIPRLSTLLMLAILIGLGTWQVHRLAWKRGLLAQIAAAEAAPAVALPPEVAPFAKVSVTGTLRDDLAALYGVEVRDERAGPVLGGQLIVPLQRQGADPVLVDRGWVPAERTEPVDQPRGVVTVAGYVRPAEHAGLFSARDDAAGRRFYTLDPAAIGAALGLPRVAPFTLVELGTAPPAGYPDPAKHLPRPPNDHLQYALTWYGFAVTLLVIFLLYARKVLRP